MINLGQGHLLTLASLLSIASSSLKSLGQSQSNFHVEHPWVGGNENSVYGKNHSKNLLLENRQADFHETWYVASMTPAHHSLIKMMTLG